ncbi:MAG: AAA family ATPase [Saprospiraceae bacterium]
MYFNRTIDHALHTWKEDLDRKPLLIRGARQVGKSSSVRNLGEQFDNFLEVNFEEMPRLKQLFERDLNPHRITEALSVYFGKPIQSGNTLLFFDEIQTCPAAISSLRFFYEKMPDLHLVAAGSLLEFALHSLPSYGVGRVRSLFMYPFSFDEFLNAIGENVLVLAKQKANFDQPLETILHDKLLDYLRFFLLIGGMPESVAFYVKHRQLHKSQQVLDDIYTALRADFTKYKDTVPPNRLRMVFESVVQQAGAKFIYAKAVDNTSHYHIKEALDLLNMAGWVIPVTHTAANGLPLGAEANFKKRKMLLLDTGIFQRILGLDISDSLLGDSMSSIHQVALAEQFWGLEYLKYANPWSPPSLYYWHREAASANAEVDYIISQGNKILPVEVKSSGSGRMQSLRQFLIEKKQAFGFRFSTENFSSYESIKCFPLYAISNISKNGLTSPEFKQ